MLAHNIQSKLTQKEKPHYNVPLDGTNDSELPVGTGFHLTIKTFR